MITASVMSEACILTVVALSLAILLLCLITFSLSIVQLRLSTPDKVYDDDDDDNDDDGGGVASRLTCMSVFLC